MKKEDRECLRNRTELIIQNLRNCNTGDGIHQVQNMRTVANLILMTLDSEENYVKMNAMVCRLEFRCVEYFKKRFGFLK